MLKDPFALLAEAEQKPKVQGPVNPKKLYFVIGSLASLVVILAVGVIFSVRSGVSADTAASPYKASVKISGVPKTVSSSDQLSLTVSIQNLDQTDIPSGFAIIEGTGIDLSSSLKSTQATSSSAGTLRTLKSDEQVLYGIDSTQNALYWDVGSIRMSQTASQQIGVTASGSTGGTKLEVKYYASQLSTYACGTLGLKRCQKELSVVLVSTGSEDLAVTNQGSIKLLAGYNFVSLPYLFTTESAKEFLTQLKDKWAYLYQATTGGYLDLNKDSNASLIKPGVGFWIYDSTGGEYKLPVFKVETSTDQPYSINLDIGWNQIGNPYAKRLILSGDKILVKEIADDGSASGSIYSLKSAIDNKILSVPYVAQSKPFTDSSANQSDLTKLLEYKVLSLGSVLSPYTGLTVSSTKKLVLTFPGREVIAPGDLLTADEKQQIESWITKTGLNQYGDKSDTVYSGGTPLFDSVTTQAIDRYDYIISKHPDRPWLG